MGVTFERGTDDLRSRWPPMSTNSPDGGEPATLTPFAKPLVGDATVAIPSWP
jgi:hypothetical protein